MRNETTISGILATSQNLVQGALKSTEKPYSVAYRFGFNGKENDSEGIGGGGSTYDYGFRIYNGQIGKFLSVDPLVKKFPMLTPYQFSSNMPIWAKDLDGAEAIIVNSSNKSITVIANIYYVSDGQYAVDYSMIKAVTDNQILKVVENNIDFQSLSEYKYNVKINIIPGGTYQNAKELAKNSSVFYNGEEIKDYRTGVLIADAKDSEHSDLYKKVIKSKDYALYINDTKEKYKLIVIRDPKYSETKTNTTSEIIEWKSNRLTHELGHFIFTLFHPSESGRKQGITSEDDKTIKLDKKDLEEQMNKRDATIIRK